MESLMIVEKPMVNVTGRGKHAPGGSGGVASPHGYKVRVAGAADGLLVIVATLEFFAARLQQQPPGSGGGVGGGGSGGDGSGADRAAQTPGASCSAPPHAADAQPTGNTVADVASVAAANAAASRLAPVAKVALAAAVDAEACANMAAATEAAAADAASAWERAKQTAAEAVARAGDQTEGSNAAASIFGLTSSAPAPTPRALALAEASRETSVEASNHALASHEMLREALANAAQAAHVDAARARERESGKCVAMQRLGLPFGRASSSVAPMNVWSLEVAAKQIRAVAAAAKKDLADYEVLRGCSGVSMEQLVYTAALKKTAAEAAAEACAAEGEAAGAGAALAEMQGAETATERSLDALAGVVALVDFCAARLAIS